MLRKIHKKVASSVSGMEIPGHFEWLKWLHPAKTYSIPIERFYVLLKRTDHIKYDWTMPELYDGKFYFKYEFVKDSTNFDLPPIQIRRIFFSVGKTSVISQNHQLAKSAEIAYSFSSESKEPGKKSKNGGVNPAVFGIHSPAEKVVKEIDFNYHSVEPEGISFALKTNKIFSVGLELLPAEQHKVDFDIPAAHTTDHLARLIPKIYNIGLLKLDELTADTASRDTLLNYNNLLETSVKVENYPILKTDSKRTKTFFIKKFSLPAAGTLDFNELEIPAAKVFKKDFNVIDLKLQNIYLSDIFDNKESSEIPQDYSASDQALSHKLKNMLQPSTDSRNTILPIYEYQRNGAKFLVAQRYALLSDQLGLGKTLQAIQALKILFSRGKVGSALIIAPQEEIGYYGLSHQLDEPAGWVGHLQLYSKEYSFAVMEGQSSERRREWEKFSPITITTFDNLVEDLDKGIVDTERLNEFDCLIIDDIQDYIHESIMLKELLGIINPEYFWALSSLSLETVEDKISSIFDLILLSMRRKREDVAGELPRIVRKKYWLEMDPQQFAVYKSTEDDIRKELQELFEVGNPYRFHANIYFKLYKLKQSLCNYDNFGEDKKASLFLNHIHTISKNQEKAILVSQYDDRALELLLNRLNAQGIKYLKLLENTDEKSSVKILENFEKDNSYSILITNVKNRLHGIQVKNVNYLIYYDEWWNPVQVRNFERELLRSGNKNLFVFSYFYRYTIDEQIQIKLTELKLTDDQTITKYSFEAFNGLLEDKDWLEILNIQKKRISVTNELKAS